MKCSVARPKLDARYMKPTVNKHTPKSALFLHTGENPDCKLCHLDTQNLSRACYQCEVELAQLRENMEAKNRQIQELMQQRKHDAALIQDLYAQVHFASTHFD